jgi:hypothetical protein
LDRPPASRQSDEPNSLRQEGQAAKLVCWLTDPLLAASHVRNGGEIMSKVFRKNRPDHEATDDEFAKAIGISLRYVTEEPPPEIDEPDDDTDTLDDDEDNEPDDEDEMSAIADPWILLHRIS